MAPASLQVNNMPMMALVNPVYDCLFRLAQPDSLRKEEEVSAGMWAANVHLVLPGTSKKHSPEGDVVPASWCGGKLPPRYVLEGDPPDRRVCSLEGSRMEMQVVAPWHRLHVLPPGSFSPCWALWGFFYSSTVLPPLQPINFPLFSKDPVSAPVSCKKVDLLRASASSHFPLCSWKHLLTLTSASALPTPHGHLAEN